MAPRQPGEFCWINIMTPQTDEARDFFSKLLGWAYEEMPGNIGHVVQVGGKNMGGIFNNVDRKGEAIAPMIGVMVKVESADAVSEKVTSLGGTGKPAFDIGDAGRMAVCTDPTGGKFDLWQAKKQADATVDGMQHGAMGWFELLTSDAARAREFYTELFGWTTQINPMPDFEYTQFKQGDKMVAGLMPILPHMTGVSPHWAVYFTVKDVDAIAKTAEELGAKLCIPVMEIPHVGRMCGITSPQGVTFYVMEWASPPSQ
jgi:predicted enzyme related to lactoylglutathione lyase